MEPYFPFGKAVERYVRSYAAMGISYENSTMQLDLLERVSLEPIAILRAYN